MKKSLILMAGVLLTAQANADEFHPYIGGGIGKTSINDSGWSVSEQEGSRMKSNAMDYHAFAGVYQDKIFGFELGYTKYGRTSIADGIGKAVDYHWQPTSISASVNMGYTSKSGIRPFVLLGGSYVKINQSRPLIKNGENGVVGLHYGIGAEYAPAVTKGVTFRVAYEGDMIEINRSSIVDPAGKDYGISLGSVYAGAAYKF
ncbi:outer membrane beta-barrel protein [Veronia pacifica]|uniref:Outer membrane protein beta-barrel domain-containing protein n=1 Tax=Veronia pacifica TaxID=1080227 RepID=A0A1C3EM85_9GAMM|nr:outer membrane beta-barrel protein [Veronia pacifica]ODA34335.1 hypothetical protein A8L45_06315 [Veronia pacifica]